MRYQRGRAPDVHGRYEFGNTWAVSSFFGFFFPLKCHMLLNWTTGLKHLVSPLGLFVCKGVCACSCSYVYTGACAHLFFVGIPEDNLTCSSSVYHPHFFWERVSHWPKTHSTGQPGWLSIKPQNPPIPTFQHWGCKHVPPCPAFCFSFFSPPFSWMWILGTKLRSSVLQALHLKDVPSCWLPFGVITLFVYTIILQIKPLYCSVCSKSASKSQIRHPPRFLWSR